MAALVVASVAFRGVGKMGLGRGLVWGRWPPAWLGARPVAALGPVNDGWVRVLVLHPIWFPNPCSCCI